MTRQQHRAESPTGVSALALSAVLVSVGLVLSGCFGSPAARPVAAALNEIGAQRRALLSDGGTLTWPIQAMPANFNVYAAEGGGAASAGVTGQILGALLPRAFDTDASGAPVWNRDYLASAPALAVGTDQVVTYRINPKAKWSDGRPVTWEDLYWQWRASSGSSPEYLATTTAGYDEIRAVARGADDREAVVTFVHRYADWRALFAPIYPASTNRNPAVFNAGWRDGGGPTAGAFRFGGLDRAGGTLTLVRDDAWWGDRAKLDRIRYRVVGDAGGVDAYLKGDVDFVDAGTDISGYQRSRGAAGTQVRRAAGPAFRVLTFNGAGPALSDARVRRALSRAIDRSAIAKTLLGPSGVDARRLDNHLLLAGQDGYRDNSGDVGRYSVSAAMRMLDQAGWPVDGDVRRRDGRPLELRMVIPAGIATSRREADMVHNFLARVKVTVKIDTVPAGDFFNQLAAGNFDLTVFSWSAARYPTGTTRSIYGQPLKDPTGRVDIRQNYARTGTAEIDALLDRAAGELDHDAWVRLANQIDAAIWAEAHSLTLYQSPDVVVTRKKLANFGAAGLATLRYQDIGWVKS